MTLCNRTVIADPGEGRSLVVSENDTPREYDRTYPKPLPGPLQIRIGVDTDRGEVVRFLVRFEYRRSGEWDTVVRIDTRPVHTGMERKTITTREDQVE